VTRFFLVFLSNFSYLQIYKFIVEINDCERDKKVIDEDSDVEVVVVVVVVIVVVEVEIEIRVFVVHVKVVDVYIRTNIIIICNK